ncbi:MAG TPA: hypothetical protein VGK73_39705 [Polyangiaceae bacterium]
MSGAIRGTGVSDRLLEWPAAEHFPPLLWFRRLVQFRERRPMAFAPVFCVLCFVGFARAGLEALTTRVGAGTTPAFVNNTTFYLQAAYLYAALTAKLSGRSLPTALSVVMVGMFLGICPPLVDVVLGNFGHGYYRYVEGGFSAWSFSLFNPAHYSTGEALVLWMSVLLPAAYVAETTRSLSRTLLALAGSYAVTTFIAVGPSSLVEWALRGASPLTPARFGFAALTFVQLVVAQLAYLAFRPLLARRLLRRLVHALPFVALTFLGNALANRFRPGDFSLLERAHYAVGAALVVLELCIVALVQNDAFDLEEDVGRPAGEATREDAYFFTGIGLVLVLAILHASPPLGTPVALFFIGTTLYSFDFCRAKRWFPVNYKLEGVWGSTSFVLGGSAVYLKYAEPPLSGAFLVATAIVFAGWFCFNVFKDYKDIRADVHAGNQTLYALAYEYGISLGRLHRALLVAFSASLLAPVALLVLAGVAAAPALLVGAAAALVAIRTLGGPPRGATVRAFLWLVTVYVVALAALVELSG